MKLAISNIAWHVEQDLAVAEIMRRYGAEGVEIAPTKVWPSPVTVTDQEVQDYRAFWADQGISVVAMQALLFGRPELTIFGDRAKRNETLRYLRKMIELGCKLGARVLVFGSPANRKAGDLPAADVERIAVEFFAQLGRVAHSHGLTFCIEPNPVVYGCDFITDSPAGLALVDQVDQPGFGLHLDAAGMTLSGEDIPVALDRAGSRIRHFHISEPDLAPIGSGGVDHATVAAALHTTDYDRWVSIEMRAPEPEAALAQVASALDTARQHYFRQVGEPDHPVNRAPRK